MNEMNMRNGDVRWTIHCQTFTVENHEQADGVEHVTGRPGNEHPGICVASDG
jgi:hypothetical protein